MKTKLLALLFPVFLVATSANAQSTSAAAEQLFRDANALLKQGKVHEACLKFTESERLDAQLGTLLNVAACHETEGRVATAWSEYGELVEQAGKKGDKKRADYAKGKVAELEKQLPHLQIDVPAGTSEIKLDGVAFGTAALGTPLPTDPGEHEIAYFAPGKKPGTQKVLVVKGETAKVELPSLETVDVTPISKSTPIATPIATSPATAPSGGGGVRTAGFVLGGLGLVGLGVGSAFGVMALGSKSNVDNGCVANQCTPAALGAVDDVRMQGAVSTVGIVAGAACLVAGLTMILVGGKTAHKLGIAPARNNHGAGLVAVGSF